MPRRIATLLFASAVASCGGGSDSTQPPPAPVRGLRVLIGGQTDTTFAILAPGLRVEVHDSSGALAPTGTPVSIAAVGDVQPKPVQVATDGSTDFRDSAVVDCDAAGLATVTLRLGTAAETARVVVAVPSLRLLDTLTYAILPGQRALARILPGDTSIVVGKSAQLRVAVTDVWGNVRNEPLAPWAFVSVDSLVATTPDGVITGRTVGTSSVAIKGPNPLLADPGAIVLVVPSARIVVEEGSPLGLWLADADGTHRRLLARVSGVFDSLFLGTRPQWMPDHGSIVYANTEHGHKVLDVVDTNGVVRPFFAQPPPNITDAAQPSVSADGEWLYFEAIDSRCSTTFYCLYCAKIDGTAPELLGTPAAAGTSLHPSSSPDGSRVAIATGYLGTGGIHVFDLATRSLSTWSESGFSPAWSPDGSVIAYVADHGGSMPGAIVRPDGTGQTDLTHVISTFNFLEWSHDGQYLVGIFNSTPTLYSPTGKFVIDLEQFPPFNTVEFAFP